MKLLFKKAPIVAVVLIVLIIAVILTAAFDRRFLPKNTTTNTNQVLTNEEANVINVVEKSSPSVVTVSGTSQSQPVIQFDPFNGGFTRGQSGSKTQDIGSGFIVSNDGLNLKAGQTVIAIGTALGQFRHTVTKGVISGLGRGIEAGDSYQGYVEQLDNIIQTDAAINPGNSGGPLINSSGQVIGINVAVAQNAQNIGFAIPINVVKDALNQFNKTGGFPSKAFLGVQYQMIQMQTAIINNVPRGAYITDIVQGSGADKAGVKVGDIITKADDKSISDTNILAQIISTKKSGDTIKLTIWRDSQTFDITATLADKNL